MDDLKERIERDLKAAFQDAYVELDAVPQSRKVGGILVWRGFEDVDQLDRQKMVWNALNHLPRDEQLRISAILTLIPEELPEGRRRKSA